jgi:hypothetical protein
MAYEPESQQRARARSVLAKTGYGPIGGHFKDGGHPDEREDIALIRKAFKEHDSQQHSGKKTRLSFRHGGRAEGGMSGSRLDQKPRGGKGKGKKGHSTEINIAVQPHPGGMNGAPPVPMPPPPAARPPVIAPPPPAMAPHPQMAGPGGPGPGMVPPGGPPMGGPPGLPPGVVPQRPIKTGGRANYKKGGKTPPGTEYQPPGLRQNVNPDMTPDSTLERAIRSDAEEKRERGDQMPQEKRGGRARHAGGGEVGPGRTEMHAGAGSGEGRLARTKHLDYAVDRGGRGAADD